MGWKGIERNKMDFILTDLLPVELSELFSFSQFYSFLLEKKQKNTIDNILKELKENKAKGNKMFENGWGTKPLKYNILKSMNTMREMSVVHPFSAINLFLFMECYQKDLLSFFDKKHCFSIRYHKKNTDLYYKTKNKALTHYFQVQSSKVGKGAIQQAGNYFTILPFESIMAFTGSSNWRMSNFKFKNYAKVDFKSCFDSVYTHVFKWIIERHVIDSKEAKNSHLFISIDRILQNINGLSSNGLIVGPEFSRLIAEILLQQIDHEINTALSNNNIVQHINYAVFRYVDDIHIFANNQHTIEIIIDKYRCIGERYLLRLNELKLVKCTTPYLPKEWLEKTRAISDIIGSFFYRGNKTQFDALPDEERFIVKTENLSIERVKDEIVVLIKKHQDDIRTVVSFLLSTILNNISKKKNGYILFGKDSIKKSMLLLDLSLFIYAFYPSFDQTRKLISMISYMNSEIDYKNDHRSLNRLAKVINDYSFIFQSGNVFDLCDWLPFLREYEISLDSKTEYTLVEKAIESNDPIILGNLLLYSQYYKPFFEEIKTKVETIIDEQIYRMIAKDYFLQLEFWYVLIFHNCPFITASLRDKLSQIVDKIKTDASKEYGKKPYPSHAVTMMVCDFLQIQSPSGNKPAQSFFNWKGVNDFSGKITFRTYQRTIFKKYRKSRFGLYASLE